jgi:hypothetical protein
MIKKICHYEKSEAELAKERQKNREGAKDAIRSQPRGLTSGGEGP